MRNPNKDIMENLQPTDKHAGSQVAHWEEDKALQNKKKGNKHGIPPMGSRGDQGHGKTGSHDMGSRTSKK